jgi:hypothetical protein
MKPDLPVVKDASWMKVYRPSGICPPATRALLFVLSPLFGLIGGVGAYYGGFLTSGLADIVVKIFTFVGLCGGIFSWIGLILSLLVIIVVLGLGFPALVGLIVSSGIYVTARSGKCRNPRLSGWAGFLGGIVAYGAFAGLAIHFGGMHETSHLTKLLPNLAPTSGWMIFFIVLDVLALVGSAAGFSWSFVNDTPFCEECQKWYGDPVKVSYAVEFYDIEIARKLIRMLESGTAQEIKAGSRLPAKSDQARITLSLERCTCDQADLKLTTTLHWQETRVEKARRSYEKSKTIVEQKSEPWFTTMVPANVGHLLEATLFSAPQGDQTA